MHCLKATLCSSAVADSYVALAKQDSEGGRPDGQTKKGSVNPQLNPSFSNPRSAAEILGAKRRFRNVFIRNPVFQRSNPPFKNYKPLIQKPWFLKHSISIYAYTYILISLYKNAQSDNTIPNHPKQKVIK